MNRRRLALLLLLLPAAPAGAVTLDEAIAAALSHDPSIAVADAGRDAADGRVTQARSGALPTVTLRGSVGYGRLDPLGYFGLNAADVTPITAQASIEQPLYTGGRVAAETARARAGLAASEAGRGAARAELAAAVAAAYGDVLTSATMIDLYRHLVAETAEIERQARLRYKAGESPSTDVSQASARLAEARGGLAGAHGAGDSARARYRNLVGTDPVGLAPLPAGPIPPATLDEAIAIASLNSPAIAQAEAAAEAAKAAVRGAKADRLPSVGAFAEAGVVRDQFFPDYRANAATVGLRANWQLYNGGLADGRIAETSAEVRAAQARLQAARMQVEEQVISTFQGVRTAALMAAAAADQARASDAALTSIRHEVRVGMKPQLDLLDAEREAIAAAARAARARAEQVVIAYRLDALLGRATP
jgi:outer membrane protein